MRIRHALLIAILTLGLTIPAAAQSRQAHMILNGQAVESAPGITAAQLQNSRLYVQAQAFAKAIGGTYSESAETGVVTITTGHDIPTVTGLHQLNPKLAQYQPLSPFVPNMGFHHGVMGPHVTLVTSQAGTVNAFELIVPAATGWFPWFDQPEGRPDEIHGLGQVYTQHVYLTDPHGIVEDAGIPVVLDGRFLSFPWEPKPYRHDGQVYIPVRPTVESLGGSIGWNDQTWTAAAQVQTGPLTWDYLVALNPKLSAYGEISPFVPNMGFHMGTQGPHLTILKDSAGKVTGVELVVPSDSTPWMPWFDQPEGQPFDLHGVGMVWTQHVYLVDPNTIK